MRTMLAWPENAGRVVHKNGRRPSGPPSEAMNPREDWEAPARDGEAELSVQTRTGSQASRLVDALESDLRDLENTLHRSRAFLKALERDARVVPGLSTTCRTWGQQLDVMIEGVVEERSRVANRVQGAPRGRGVESLIETAVDEELASRVQLARRTPTQ